MNRSSSRRRVNVLPKYINCRHYKFLLTLVLFSIVDSSGKTGDSLNVVLLADINRITTITDRRCSKAVLSNRVSDNRLFTSHLLLILTLIVVTYIFTLLLSIAGDVHPNTGPSESTFLLTRAIRLPHSLICQALAYLLCTLISRV